MGTGRSRAANFGFTLIEVLIAFLIFSSILLLVVSGFSRHLYALQLIQDSLKAYRLSDRQLIREAINREFGVSVPIEEGGDGFTVRMEQSKISLEQEPLKGFPVTRVTAEASWSRQGRARTVQMVSGFPEDAAEKGGS